MEWGIKYSFHLPLFWPFAFLLVSPMDQNKVKLQGIE